MFNTLLDIYRLNKEVDQLINSDSQDKTNEIRMLAKELEIALELLTVVDNKEDSAEQLDGQKDSGDTTSNTEET